MLAITRAGAVAVPLDARSPSAELARALDHSSARVIFTDTRNFGTVRDAVARTPGGGIVVLITIHSEHAVDNLANEWRVVRLQDWVEDEASSTSHVNIDELGIEEMAYLHYTSGTTSAPKGALSTQQSWLWSANSFISAFGMTPEDRFFWPLPLFHCLGHALCVFATVVVGASAHIPDHEESSFNSLLGKDAQDTTIIVGVPAMYHEFINEASNSKILPALQALRACMTAGSMATSDLNVQVQKLFGIPLLNNYGCTEACGAIAINKPGDLFSENSSGTVVPGMEVKLAHPNGQEVRNSETGEVWIRSPSLMLGYYKETESSFTVDGWFRTGDVARFSANATDLNLIGREKELIVQGGENIQPDEVEQVLLRCDGVADVVVAGTPHITLGETAAAFIVRDGSGKDETTTDLDLTALIARCRKDLPDHKVPTSKQPPFLSLVTFFDTPGMADYSA